MLGRYQVWSFDPCLPADGFSLAILNMEVEAQRHGDIHTRDNSLWTFTALFSTNFTTISIASSGNSCQKEVQSTSIISLRQFFGQSRAPNADGSLEVVLPAYLVTSHESHQFRMSVGDVDIDMDVDLRPFR
jgi:hypothetical protein